MTSNSLLAAGGRALLGSLFLVSGVGKLAAPAATIGYIGAAGLPFPTLGYAAALAVEIAGGLALVFGWRLRLVAGILAVFSVAAAIGFHADFADQNQMVHFLKNLAIAGGLLQVAAFAGGPASERKSADEPAAA